MKIATLLFSSLCCCCQTGRGANRLAFSVSSDWTTVRLYSTAPWGVLHALAGPQPGKTSDTQLAVHAERPVVTTPYDFNKKVVLDNGVTENDRLF